MLNQTFKKYLFLLCFLLNNKSALSLSYSFEKTIYFEKEGVALSAEKRTEIIEYLKSFENTEKYSCTVIVLIGYSEKDEGNEKERQILASKRAEYVKNLLEINNVKIPIYSEGKGNYPNNLNETNQRVEIEPVCFIKRSYYGDSYLNRY